MLSYILCTKRFLGPCAYIEWCILKNHYLNCRFRHKIPRSYWLWKNIFLNGQVSLDLSHICSKVWPSVLLVWYCSNVNTNTKRVLLCHTFLFTSTCLVYGISTGCYNFSRPLHPWQLLVQATDCRMDLAELENVLAGTLSPDQNIRKAAELHLKKVCSFACYQIFVLS